ncbi:MAG: MAE_28990/MAE_18760 family HEPN-like nuclease [Pseudomonadota bacterium]
MGRKITSPTPALKRFRKTHNEAKLLINIQEEYAGTKKGKKHIYWKPLNQSAVVFLMAAWEAYIEDVCSWSIEYILKKRPKSNHLLSKAADKLYDNIVGDDKKVKKNGKEKLLKIFVENNSSREIEKLLKYDIDALHNPNSTNVATLVHLCSGLRDITKSWKWRGQSYEGAVKKINKYMKARHRIAHGRRKAIIKKEVNRTYAKDCLDFVDKLINVTDQTIVKHLAKNIKVGQ